jgi:hypothetical protein
MKMGAGGAAGAADSADDAAAMNPLTRMDVDLRQVAVAGADAEAVAR